MDTIDRTTLSFHDFELDVAAYVLRRRGRAVKLERRPMDLLILLVENRQRLVSRAEIVDLLWGKDVFVDVDTGINTAVSKVRQALRDSAEAPRFIETVAGKGYRFIAEVRAAADAREPAPPPPQTETSAPPEPPLTARRRAFSRAAATIVGAVAVAVAAVLASLWLGRGSAVGRVTLAVLPFDDLSAGAERAYLADGLAEETIAALGQIDPDHVRVVGRTSTLAYKQTRKPLAAIGHELGVDYLVESSIRAEGERIRITSKLIRVSDQVDVWSASFDREPTSILAMQRELSEAIAEQIRVRVSPVRLTAVSRRQTADAEAYDLYLHGRTLDNERTPAATKKAIEYYSRATALDPNYALAWAGLALAYTGRAINSDARPGEVAAAARDAAARAVSADPNLAEAQTAAATVKFMIDWDWPGAERAARRAVVLDPHYDVGFRELGHVLSQRGQSADAEAAMRRTREIDPLFAMNDAIWSQVAFQARDYPAALARARQAIVVDPTLWIGYEMAAQAYEQLGDTERALSAADEASRRSDANSKTLSLRGHVLAKAGRIRDARDVLGLLEAASAYRYVPPYAMALVYAGLGERDATFAWLERAFAAHDVHLIYLPVDVKWDAYRADPRFGALLERCGFLQPAAH